MTRIKKKRTEKSIGAAKKPLEKQSERTKELSKKKGKGRPAGAKANIDGALKKTKSRSKSSQSATDDRVGSKTPINLILEAPKKALVPRVSVKKSKAVLTPEQQLHALENDERLNKLLDLLDADQEISEKDQAYIEHQTAHHQKLIAELDLDDEDNGDAEEELEEWQKLDSSEFDEFKE